MTEDLASELASKVIPIYVCEDFVQNHPIWFDRSKIWWVWNLNRSFWEMRDDIDVLNMIYDGLGMTGIASNGLKGQYITSMQMAGRKTDPQSVPKEWVQFKDAVFDITRNQRMTADSSFFFTNPIPWNCGGQKKECPTIDSLFEQWVGPEQKPLLYEICAYCMLTDYPIHRIFCLIGGGRNGKGSFMRVLKKLVGVENCASTSLDRITESRFEAAKLYKKLVAFVGETNFSILENTALVKSLVGQDLIPGEFKNKPGFDFMNYAKIIIATNSLPMTTDKTIGFYSRWIIIDFKNTFEETINIIDTIPEEEYDALAQKCLGLLTEIIKNNKFTNEGDIQKKTERYEDRSNPLKKFLDERVEKADMDQQIWLWQFTETFQSYLNDNRFRIMSEKEIKRKLEDSGFEIDILHTKNNEGKETRWAAILGHQWKVHKNPTPTTQQTLLSNQLPYIENEERSDVARVGHVGNASPLGDNSKDQPCYKCGKFTNIHFPDPYDAEHKEMWCCIDCVGDN